MFKKLRRGICLALSAVVAAAGLAGCESKGARGDELLYYVVGTEKADTAAILEEVNTILKEKTGNSVKFEFLNSENYDLVLSSGDDYDLIFAPDYLNYWQNAAKGAFAEISDEEIQKYIPYIWENGGNTLDVTKYKGVRYGIANLHNYASDRCFVARGDLMDKYGIDGLYGMEDVEAYLTAVAENEPDLIPFDMPGNTSYLLLAMFANDWGWAPVGSLSYGEHVYFHLDDPEQKLFIAAEQPEMLEFSKTMKRWNDKGFFSKSVLSNKTSSLDSFKAGRSALGYVNSPSECQIVWDELQSDDRANWDIRFYSRYQKSQQMYNYTNGIVAISAFSKNKEAAMSVINEMYQNREIYNLIHYGIEGRHYTLNDANEISNTVDYEAKGAISTGIYNDNMEYEPELTFPGAHELVEKFANMRRYNPAVNCPLSDEGIREIKLALSEVYNQYTAPRYYGIVSGTVEDAIATEIAELKTAGIDQYLASIQTQLDEYMNGIGK